MEERVEEEKGWGRLDDLDGEYEICICSQEGVDEVECYTIKVPDQEARTPLSYLISRPSAPLRSLIHGVQTWDISNFTPKNLSPLSETTNKGPQATGYLALLNNHLYSVGGNEEVLKSECAEARGADYFVIGIHRKEIVMPGRFVWTLDLTCPDMGWKQLAKPMRNRRKDPKTIVVDGKLYVFGGLKGYEPIPEDRSSGRGWMEVYDPILETWKSLPNPPSYTSEFECIFYAHLELERDKHEIVVVDNSEGKKEPVFLKYNVMSSTWETWFQYPVVVNSNIQCGRAVVVDGTKAYWASSVFRGARNLSNVTVFGFDLISKSWAYKDLDAGPFLGYSERFIWTDPGFLHLSDHKFCLLLHSVRSPDRILFLYCIVLDLPAFIGPSCFPKKPLLHSVVSVQKYSLDKSIDLLDCMIINRGTQPPKKETTEEM
ncbi:hypothetical protein ACB092_07G144200 [Castanea dentata]